MTTHASVLTSLAQKSRRAWLMVREAGNNWFDDNASRLAAALAYYTLLSVAPLLVIAVSIAGLVFGPDAARGRISAELLNLVGPQAAETIQAILANANAPYAGIFGSAVGIVILLIGASGVFGELQSALNIIWKVPPSSSSGISALLKERFFSFAMVLGVAFLLLVSLVVSAGIGAAGGVLQDSLAGGEFLWQVLNLLLSLAITSGLFALIFKVVPDVPVAWRDVWLGAIVTACLFTLGKFLLGLYLGKAMISSAYGAAGSAVVFVVWVYYSAQILLLGAEFTCVYAKHMSQSPTA